MEPGAKGPLREDLRRTQGEAIGATLAVIPADSCVTSTHLRVIRRLLSCLLLHCQWEGALGGTVHTSGSEAKAGACVAFSPQNRATCERCEEVCLCDSDVSVQKLSPYICCHGWYCPI